jgi:hypothetical protein
VTPGHEAWPKESGGRHLFIVGMARTGSTLLRHTLNRAPEVCLASETHFLRWSRGIRLSERLRGIGSAPRPRDHALGELAERFFEDDAWLWLRRNSTPSEFAALLAGRDLSERAIFALLMELYAERRCGRPIQTTIMGEKTPDHLQHVGQLLEWFPNARVIHTFRDPRAIYLSELQRWRQGRWGMKARMPWLPSAISDPVLAPVQAVRTSVAWRAAARIHRQLSRVLGARYRLVRFEDLVTQPADELLAICRLIDVPFRPELLEGIDVVGSSFETDRHAGPGFDVTKSTRWTTELGPVSRRWFAATLGSWLDAFGYSQS